MSTYYAVYDDLTLSHHGIKGQRWGVRRYQNADGSLTEAGKKKLASYKDSQSSYITTKYDKKIGTLTAKSTKYAEKASTAKANGKVKAAAKASEKKKTLDAEAKAYGKYKQTQLSSIKKTTVNDLLSENKSVRVSAAVLIATTFAAAAIAPFTGVMVYSLPKSANATRESVRNSRASKEFVAKYKKQHPNTELSDDQIALNGGYAI